MQIDSTLYDYFVDLESYKTCLLEDFSQHESFAKLASDISRTDASSIIDWVKSIKGNDIRYLFENETFQYQDITFDRMKDIEYHPVFYPESEGANLYTFFSYRSFSSYEEMERSYPRSYYVFDNPQYFNKIKAYVRSALKDYTLAKQGSWKCLTKKISDRITINLLFANPINKHSEVYDYHFPFVQLEIDGYRVPIIEADPRLLLLMDRGSFTFFYIERNVFKYDEELKQVTSVIPKREYPVYYQEDDKYIVSNSHEKLETYNKFIYITLELFNHYYFVFEKWLIDRAENLLRERGGAKL